MLLESEKIDLGTPLVNFKLPGIDGQTYTPESFRNYEALVVVVSCNHCPYAVASWPILIALQKQFQDKGVRFVAINPNDGVRYPDDAFEKMAPYAETIGLNFPYLRDETQQVARDLRAQCTPDIYVYNNRRKLYYHGRINDNWQHPEKVTQENLKDAISRLVNNEPAPERQYPSMGCSIKWK